MFSSSNVMSASSNDRIIRFKWYHKKEQIRRFQLLEAELNYNNFYEIVLAIEPRIEDFFLYYIDMDDDIIVFSTEAEFKELLKQFNEFGGGTISIFSVEKCDLDYLLKHRHFNSRQTLNAITNHEYAVTPIRQCNSIPPGQSMDKLTKFPFQKNPIKLPISYVKPKEFVKDQDEVSSLRKNTNRREKTNGICVNDVIGFGLRRRKITNSQFHIGTKRDDANLSENCDENWRIEQGLRKLGFMPPQQFDGETNKEAPNSDSDDDVEYLHSIVISKNVP